MTKTSPNFIEWYKEKHLLDLSLHYRQYVAERRRYKVITLKVIEEFILKVFEISEYDLKVNTRTRDNYIPRSFLILLAIDCGWTRQAIGTFLNNRNPSSITNAFQTIQEQMERDEKLSNQFTEVKNQFEESLWNQ